jgi:hypothetical protein
MEIKLKQPSQESINQAYLEMINESKLLDFELNYEWLIRQENIHLRSEVTVKDLLDRATMIENFGVCRKEPSNICQSLIVNKDNGSIYYEQHYSTLSVNPLTPDQIKEIQEMIDKMSENFINQNY